jgi:hypothetical protein
MTRLSGIQKEDLMPPENPDADYTVFANPSEVVHHLAEGRCRDGYSQREYLAAMEAVRRDYPRLFALSQTVGARDAELKIAEGRYRREGLMP